MKHKEAMTRNLNKGVNTDKPKIFNGTIFLKRNFFRKEWR